VLTLIGTILGIFSGLLPEVVKYFNAKQDRAHELAVMNLQIEQQKLGFTQRIEEINVNADVKQEELSIQASTPQTLAYTGKWVDYIIGLANILLALASGLVRPTITYCYFFAYAAVKYAQYLMLKVETASAAQTIVALWSQDDMAMFATVITFWFSSRMFSKARAGLGNSNLGMPATTTVLTKIP
jgi:hypothetical protein